MDTIYALATARGKAGVAVIRVSGPRAHDVGKALSGSLPPLRTASLRGLSDSEGRLLDKAIMLAFAKGASFTGEDVVELMCHGGLATIAAVEAAVASYGARLAEPGEFTRRALSNGCLDLTQVEALADMLEAETEAQRRQAMAVLDGALGRLVEGWRARLLRAAALVEVSIDFVDEDLGDFDYAVLAEISPLRAELRNEIAGQAGRERVRVGFEVALVGPVNVGKSTLLNALAGREAAITSEFAGTTRDVIELRMDIGGFAVTLLDTAGLRETDEAIEAIGIARARERAARADLRVILLEAKDAKPVLVPREDDIVLLSKADLPGSVHGVSGLTGQGIDTLLSDIEVRLSRKVVGDGVITRRRHMEAMTRAEHSLDSAIERLGAGVYAPELVAADLRDTMSALDGLIGRIGVEDVLGDIFASFCIGK